MVSSVWLTMAQTQSCHGAMGPHKDQLTCTTQLSRQLTLLNPLAQPYIQINLQNLRILNKHVFKCQRITVPSMHPQSVYAQHVPHISSLLSGVTWLFLALGNVEAMLCTYRNKWPSTHKHTCKALNMSSLSLSHHRHLQESSQRLKASQANTHVCTYCHYHHTH